MLQIISELTWEILSYYLSNITITLWTSPLKRCGR